MIFRKDINGLRAIAVLGVLLFHFNPLLLPGGFAGVDVFFVISGYLMTSIIYSKFKQDSFNYRDFLIARANRIFPALFFLCGVLLIFGWFHLPPTIFKELGIHVAGSLTYTSNVLYWLQMGYFSSAANEKWLLHTWSLSSEWQFYLFYPLLLIALMKTVTDKALKYVILFISLLSFSLGLYSSIVMPDASYYLLHTRAWEMLAGGLIFFFPVSTTKKSSNILFYTGLAFILLSYIFVNEDVYWPGWYTLMPVLGVCFIFWANKKENLVLNNVFSQKIGNWSYSIYLWHWPIVVFLNYLNLNTFLAVVLGILLSLILGAISYYVVEKRALFKNQVGSWMYIYKLPSIYLSFVIFVLSILVFFTNGFKSRDFSEKTNFLESMVMPTSNNGYCFLDFSEEVDWKRLNSNCYLGDDAKDNKVLLYGDSFAGQYEPFLDQLFKEVGKGFQSKTTNWCYPSLSNNFTGPKSHPSYEHCLKNRELVSRNISSYETIIIAGMWLNIYNEGYFDDVILFIDYALENGASVIILPSPKVYKTNIAKRYQSSLFSSLFSFNTDGYTSQEDKKLIDLHAAFETISASNSEVIFVRRLDLFNESGVFYINDFPVPYSLDSAHISKIGSLNLLPKFRASDRYSKFLEIVNK